MSYIVKLEEDSETGDLILPLPEKLLEETGWKTGDTLDWTDRCISLFRLFYPYLYYKQDYYFYVFPL